MDRVGNDPTGDGLQGLPAPHARSPFGCEDPDDLQVTNFSTPHQKLAMLRALIGDGKMIVNHGSEHRIRTDDIRLIWPALYQLS